MKTNLRPADRWIRVIIGLAVLTLGLAFKSWWGLVGLIPLATGAIGYCGLYTVCGINKHSAQHDAPPAS